MATVSQQNIGTQHEKITINITQEDYLPEVDKALKKISKTASIPGFRKGMVPLGHIKKVYGQSVFADEILRVAGEKLENHLTESKVEIFARPIPAATQESYQFDSQNPQDYQFEFEIGTKPPISIPFLNSSSTMPLYKVSIHDAMLNEEIEKLLLKAGDMKEIETIADDSNVLHLEIKNNADISRKRSLLLSYFSQQAKELLKGKKAEESIEIRLGDLFADTYKQNVLTDLGIEQNQDETFTVFIEKVENIEKAELNKDTFEKIYPGKNIETEEDFKTQLKTEIQSYWDSQARNYLHNEVFEKLVHETPIDIPIDFLKRWMSIGGDSYKPMEQVEKEFGHFDHQLRWQLITEKIIADNEIDVKKDEMEQATRMQIVSYFGQYGTMPSMDEEWMEPLVKKQLADKKFADDLYNRILTDKIFFVIENTINLQETEISQEDFLKLLNTPSHHHDHEHHH